MVRVRGEGRKGKEKKEGRRARAQQFASFLFFSFPTISIPSRQIFSSFPPCPSPNSLSCSDESSVPQNDPSLNSDPRGIPPPPPPLPFFRGTLPILLPSHLPRSLHPSLDPSRIDSPSKSSNESSSSSSSLQRILPSSLLLSTSSDPSPPRLERIPPSCSPLLL